MLLICAMEGLSRPLQITWWGAKFETLYSKRSLSHYSYPKATCLHAAYLYFVLTLGFYSLNRA